MRLFSSNGSIQAVLGTAFVATVVLVNWMSATEAAAKRAVPDSVKVACSGDYKRFCPGYEIGTSKLDRCMRSNGKRLSNVCVRELVDNGMVPRSLLSKARRR